MSTSPGALMILDSPDEGAGGGVPKRQREDDLKWEKGKFQLLFIYMGRGDCCVVTCPDGKHIIIDCGWNQEDKDVDDLSVVKLIRNDDVLNLNGSEQEKVEALILTHPDEDHVSKVGWVLATEHERPTTEGTSEEPPTKKRKTEGEQKLDSYKAIKIKKVYFSDTKSIATDAPMWAYDQLKKGENCGHTIKNVVMPEELIRVRLNKQEKKYDKWTKPYDKTKYVEGDIAGDEFTVLKADDNTWSVSIIAGNVLKDAQIKEDKSDAQSSNAGSLVVLIRIGREKALICGDATLSTEKYLVEKYKEKNDIKDLDLIQVPHHGSETTSSSDEFVKMTCPKRAIISVKKTETGNHHPSKTVIDRYKRHAVEETQHPIQHWVQNKTGYQLEKNSWQRAPDTFEVKGKTWVKKAVDENFVGCVAIGGGGSSDGYKKAWMLYQEVTKKNIRQTGVSKDLWIYLTGTPDDTRPCAERTQTS